MIDETPCPCGNNDNGKPKAFSQCCQPFINLKKRPDHCEQLMRSRFAAYSMGAVDYLLSTWHPTIQPELNRDELLASVEITEWLRLEVLRSDQKDEQGMVDFKAYYRDSAGERDEVHCLHEISRFEKVGEQWFYLDGEYTQSARLKVGRNDFCPCGSGKKFKKCCS